jgi:hypothetical protein
MDTDKLLKLYELGLEEEQRLIERYRQRIGLHAGFAVTLAAGGVAALVRARPEYAAPLLLVEPAL